MREKRVILTGDRPTGKLHIGHYLGSLLNRLQFQKEHTSYFIIADLHMLTTSPEMSKEVAKNCEAILLDYLSVGIDPEKARIFRQSRITEIPYLACIFSNFVTVPRASRIPSLKDMMQSLHITHPSMGLLSYPILQSADILIVKADLVPVGKDQKSHIELTREIAREFNTLYKPIFPEPEPLIGEVETLVGIDGKNKMSKSLGNCIYLSDSEKEVNDKVKVMFTDPEKVHVDDPGHPETCPVFIYHKAFSQDHARVEEARIDCKKGTLGCGTHKEELAQILNTFLNPIREKRRVLENQKESLRDILRIGEEEVKKKAVQTLDETLTTMKIKTRGII